MTKQDFSRLEMKRTMRLALGGYTPVIFKCNIIILEQIKNPKKSSSHLVSKQSIQFGGLTTSWSELELVPNLIIKKVIIACVNARNVKVINSKIQLHDLYQTVYNRLRQNKKNTKNPNNPKRKLPIAIVIFRSLFHLDINPLQTR